MSELKKSDEAARSGGDAIVVALRGLARIRPAKSDEIVAMGSEPLSLMGSLRHLAHFYGELLGDGAPDNLEQLVGSTDEDLRRVLFGVDGEPNLATRTHGELVVVVASSGHSQLLVRNEEKASA